jgi:hypothetical protein
MAQSFGRVTAGTWRRAASTVEEASDAYTLIANAERSEALADLAGSYWPVRDRYGVLTEIARAEEHRFFDLDNPDAMFDLRTAAETIRATCEAVGLALGAGFERFSYLLIEPVMAGNLEMDQFLGILWNHQLHGWVNLLRDEPGPYYDEPAE